MNILVGWLMVWACGTPDSLSAAAVTDDAVTESPDPLSWSIDAQGPFQVGYLSWDHRYLLSEALGERSIRIHLWYPTEETTGPVGMYTVGTDPDVIAGAALSPSVYTDGYPVHVHSHGDLHLGTGSAFLARHLASHGWVSVAMDHTGNTLLDLNADPSAANFFHRPLDVRAALDAVEGHAMLDGQADTRKSILSGHSRGAYTTWASLGAEFDLDSVEQMCATGEGIDGDGCSADELAMFYKDLSDGRVVATIPLDGTIRRQWFGVAGEATVHGPVLYFSPTESSGGQAQFDGLADIDFRWVRIDDACHQTFATGECSDLAGPVGFQIVNTIALAFARMVVLADSSEQVVSALAGDVNEPVPVTVTKK